MRLPFSRRHPAEPSYGITTADTSHLDDIAKRQRQYIVTMLIRVAAILVVVMVPGLTLLERTILGLVAMVIPYVAVVRANGGPDQSEAPTNLMIGPPRQAELPAPGRVLSGGYRIDGEAEEGFDDEEDGDEGYRADGSGEHGAGDADGADERFVRYQPPPPASRGYEAPPAQSPTPSPAASPMPSPTPSPAPSRKRIDAYGSTASSVSTASPAPKPPRPAPNADSGER